MKKVIAGTEIEDTKISSASEMEEAFNCHFANTGHELARDIPPVDTVPESYSTLSSVYVTTESHEKRMRVADQCALRFAGSFTL